MRVIVRLFKPKDDMTLFAPGYLPKLSTDVLQKEIFAPDLQMFQDGLIFSIATTTGNLEIRLELQSSDMSIRVEVRAESSLLFNSRPTSAFKKMIEIRDLIMGRGEEDNTVYDGIVDVGGEATENSNWRLNLALEEYGVDPRPGKNRKQKMTDVIGVLKSNSADKGEAPLFAYGCQNEYAFDEQFYKPEKIESAGILILLTNLHKFIIYCTHLTYRFY